MPELPEVEEVRRSLEPQILGRRVNAVRLLRADVLTLPVGARADDLTDPLSVLIGQRFSRTHRHGKKLFCVLESGQTLMIHLGMTGRLGVAARAVPLLTHTHLVLTLDNDTEIRFRDPRRFGGVWYYPTFEVALTTEIAGRMGPDALVLSTEHLACWRARRKGAGSGRAGARLKARLLGQRDVAGLGNIYVDEALWISRLHPLQRVDRLRPPELRALVSAIHTVLQRSIRLGGTTLRDYRNAADKEGAFRGRLQVYGRAGAPCRRCARPLAAQRIAGCTTVFCAVCQKRHA
jgi:formamidopyrimidine-DNA glycosylase